MLKTYIWPYLSWPLHRYSIQYFGLKTASIKAKSLWNDVFPSHIISLRLQGRQYFGLPGNPAPFFRGRCTKNFLVEVGLARSCSTDTASKKTERPPKMYYIYYSAYCCDCVDYITLTALTVCEAKQEPSTTRPAFLF